MAELSYMEADDEVSEYRLKRTFEGSRTSYRLLMFTELFRRTARSSASGGEGVKRKSLAQIRDDLFDRHGGPPPGAAALLASEVRRLQNINDFPSFLREMGVTIPGRLSFSQMLRRTVRESMARGYSKWALERPDAQALRQLRERGVPSSHATSVIAKVMNGEVTFFPQTQKGGQPRGNQSRRGGRWR